MTSASLSHRRTHNLLLISKLLGLRDCVSPLTLLLDTLEQPATRLLQQYIQRVKASKLHVTFISFETVKRPEGVDAFISARRKRPSILVKEVAGAYSAPSLSVHHHSRLIIIDSIHPLLNPRGPDGPIHLPTYLSSLIAPASPAISQVHTSLVVTYHQDIPILSDLSDYSPSPLSLLTYLATTIFTLHSFSHILAEKAARDRSLVAPIFGLEEQRDGVILGQIDRIKGQETVEGIVLEMEHRRKSGRAVVEWYFLPPATQYPYQQAKEPTILLDDHPLYRRPEDIVQEDEPESTFELRLTERQRREREGVVLPYLDAQQGDGPGEGGRILYDMGEEDDFDEEEDEI